MKPKRIIGILALTTLLASSLLMFNNIAVTAQNQNTTTIQLLTIGGGIAVLANQTTHTSDSAAKLLIPASAQQGSGCMALYPYNKALSTLLSFQIYMSFSNAVPRFVILLDTNKDNTADVILLSDYQFQSNYNWQLAQGGQRWGWTESTLQIGSYGKSWNDLNYWKNIYANATALSVGVALEYWAVKDSGGLDQSLYSDEIVINGATFNISKAPPTQNPPPTNQQPSQDFWTTYRHDPQGSGSSSSTAPKGNLLWKFNTGDKIRSSPVIADGVVYEGSNTGCVYALNASNGNLIWQYNSGSNIDGSPAIANGIVYIGILWDGHNGYVTALNATNGVLLWKFATNSGVESSPTIVNGILYIGSYSGFVYALNATTGTQIWYYLTGGTTFSSPAVANGVLYIGSGNGRVYALNADNGVPIWAVQAGDIIYSSPAFANNIIYAVSENGNVYALSANNGAVIWQAYVGTGTDHTDTSPAVANGIVYICARNGNYAFNATTGAQIWFFTSPYSSRQLTGYMYSSPAIAGDIVYFGSVDSYIFAANAYSGSIIWAYRTGGFLFASPTIADGTLYVGSYDGYIYALGGTASTPALTQKPTPTSTPQPSTPTPTSTPSPMPTATPKPKPTPTPLPSQNPTPSATPLQTPNPTLNQSQSAIIQQRAIGQDPSSEQKNNPPINIDILAAVCIIATEVLVLSLATLVFKKKP